MLRTVVKFILLSEAFAVVTFAGGWSGVPVLALVMGLFANPDEKGVRWATLCAAAAWLELLLLDASRGPLGEVATRFAGVLGLPPLALFGITLLFAALLAWSASSIGSAIRAAVLARRLPSANAHVHSADTSMSGPTSASAESGNAQPSVATADA